jgi:putative oxidoreductase
MPHTRHRLRQWVFHPPPDGAPPVILLIRLMAGGVFVGEGLLKWLFPATLGVGRFLALGIPAPALMATGVGAVEIIGGTLVLLGWCTRLVAIPLMLDMVVAIGATTIPRWLGTSPVPPLVLPPVGFPALLYDLRSDVVQLWGAFWLFRGGAGPWALDALLARTRQAGNARAAQERVVR